VTDLDRVRQLVRQLHRELGLDADQMPKKKPVEVRYEDAPQGGQWMIDVDEDGNEVHRQYVRSQPMVRGLVSTVETEPYVAPKGD
jgi:hypothetical protein